ncbi:MAG: hypothetical protein HC880_04940, partial [Bacteroidia bacterium]|nr:hypothetical protein [Bacteroidia bacterium]
MDEEIIDRYLRNQLSQEEKQLFEEELENNPALAKDRLALEILRLANERELRAKMKTWRSEVSQPKTSLPKPRYRYAFMAAAAIAAGILLIGLLYPRQKEASILFKENFTALEISTNKTLPDNADYQADIINLYDSSAYQTIIERYTADRGTTGKY